MKRLFLSFLILPLFLFGVLAQTEESKKFDEFGEVPCGDFMARMDVIFHTANNLPDSKVYVVYYGGRFRRSSLWNEKTKSFDKFILKYPHREDGLNWAKSIPLYLTSELIYGTKARFFKENEVVLINGGFRENTEVEVWLTPKGSEPPVPTPTVDEKNIKFRTGKPRRVPNFTNCYSHY